MPSVKFLRHRSLFKLHILVQNETRPLWTQAASEATLENDQRSRDQNVLYYVINVSVNKYI